MGIVNRTPDSFSDGGIHLADNAARARIHQLVIDGADVVDVGAESTKPGAAPVAAADQIGRIGDAIRWVIEAGAAASVDTTSAQVASYAVEQGASIINSVSLEATEALAEVAAANGADLVLTHSRGSQENMAGFSLHPDDDYEDLVGEVAEQWCAARDAAVAMGMDGDRILFDPGLGFAKNAVQSLELCASLGELKRRIGGHRVLVGTSRKSYVAKTVAAMLGESEAAPSDRLGGTIAATLDCVARGADIVRVHDVAAVRQALAYQAAMAAMAPSGRPQATIGSRGGGGA
jgi:dihydropteroate synthase